MNYKLICIALILGIVIIASGCTGNTKTMNTTITPINPIGGVIPVKTVNDTTEHPNIKANLSHAPIKEIEANLAHAPMQKAPAPKIPAPSPTGGVVACMNKGVTKINQVYSYNWAGYSIDGTVGSVSDVKGSWIVPKVNTTSKAKNQYSSTWIGIDGDNSQTVEQIGTDSDTDANGNPVYYAWYEFYPNPCHVINKFPVKSNDKITAEISYNKRFDSIILYINDITSRKSFSIMMPAKGYSRSSAEWITEAPWSNGILPLTNFGVTYFGQIYVSKGDPCKATIGKTTGAIDAFGNNTNIITMVSQQPTNDIMAQPSSLTGKGTSFSLAWMRAS